MKWIILLILFLILLAMIAVRYRRQISAGIEIYKMFRQLRNPQKPSEKQINPKKNEKETALVRCARCGTWKSQGDAINLRSKTSYCSASCMEKAASN